MRLTGMFLSINLMKRPWWFILLKAFDKSRAHMLMPVGFFLTVLFSSRLVYMSVFERIVNNSTQRAETSAKVTHLQIF